MMISGDTRNGLCVEPMETTPSRRNELGAGLLRILFAPNAVPFDLPNAQAADQYAQDLLQALGQVYQVSRWNTRRFEQLLLRGAVPVWRPGARVDVVPDGLRLSMPGCPLQDEVSRDSKVCEFCQQVQKCAAQRACGRALEATRFDSLVSQGAEACVVRFRLASGR